MWSIFKIARTAAVGTRILRSPAPLISRLRFPRPAIRPTVVFALRPQSSTIKMEKPMLMLAFTCKKCHERSSHIISKQAYTSGTVLIFSDRRINIEDILALKGESVTVTPEDLAFEDIPEKLRDLIGHHAKDAPQKAEPDTPLLKE
ncbi:hypothetical protein KL947_005020 [Ogataea haglerorum]|nr:hypothetical protein KL947_005020 [Ogataea haglerorum]